MKPDPYNIQSCLAACNDLKARADGCTNYERRLRDASPVGLYQNDPTFREIMIELAVLKQRNQRWTT